MFFTMILAAIVYYMVSDSCANMSMYCLLVFGLISGFESLFGVLTLFSAQALATPLGNPMVAACSKLIVR